MDRHKQSPYRCRFRNPSVGPVEKRRDDTIRTTLSYPFDGYGPRARKGSPCRNTGCVRLRNEERERITIKEEDSYLALVPTVCVKGG